MYNVFCSLQQQIMIIICVILVVICKLKLQLELTVNQLNIFLWIPGSFFYHKGDITLNFHLLVDVLLVHKFL